MPIPPEILVVSCHPQHCKPLVVALDKMGIRVSMVFSAEEAARALAGIATILAVRGLVH